MLECLLSMCLSTTTPLTTGPVLGDLTPTQVRVWCRTDGPANVEVVATPADGAAAVTATMQTMADSDFTANVQLEGLRPGTRYTYAINGRTDSDWWIDVPPIPHR